MKKPEEIKKGLVEAIEEASWVVEGGDAHDLIDAVENAHASMADALSLIQQLESQVPRWISVEERLPERKPPYCQTVNVRTIDGKVLPGFCNHGLWYVMREEDDFCNDADEGEVTHWMPLPKAPKEDAK